MSLTPATVAAAALPTDSSWNLAFADEYDSTALDKSKWHTCHWWSTTTCSIETNKEPELEYAYVQAVSENAADAEAFLPAPAFAVARESMDGPACARALPISTGRVSADQP